jgi:peroxin-6
MPASEAGGSVVRRRRVRRRRHDKSALSARLVLDDHVKTDVGIVSEDLFAELFPHLQDCVFFRKLFLQSSSAVVLIRYAQCSPRR